MQYELMEGLQAAIIKENAFMQHFLLSWNYYLNGELFYL